MKTGWYGDREEGEMCDIARLKYAHGHGLVGEAIDEELPFYGVINRD